TGKERDAESGLDYFGARYNSGPQGRFMNPDAPFADQQVNDPQSWNLYTYVRNNPLKYIDPTGRAVWKIAYRVYVQYKHSRRLVGQTNEISKRGAEREAKRLLDSIDTRQGGHRQVEVPTETARDVLAGRLSPDKKFRGPEQSPGYAEHVNPKSGPYADVHIQTKAASREAGFLNSLAPILAPYSDAASRDQNSTPETITSAAALWDIASAIDPIFLTDAIEWVFGLSPKLSDLEEERKRRDNEHKK
ncbi:MAG: RHS repeat-associated core domain-containing protein, partial [Nitrososphaera sp.]